MKNIELMKLGEIGELLKGIFFFDLKNNETENDDGIMVLSISDIQQYIETDLVPNFKKYNKSILSKKIKKNDVKIEKDDIVIPSIISSGSKRIMLIQNAIENGYYKDNMFIFRKKSSLNNIKNEYIATILNSDFYSDYLVKISKQLGISGIGRLTQTILEEVKIPIISIEEQIKLLEKIEQAKRLMNEANQEVNQVAQMGNIEKMI